jgi:AmmeMemoRadiSam system protein A
MAPLPSPDPSRGTGAPRLGPADEDRLLDIAEWAIHEGFRGPPGTLEPADDWSHALRSPAGCFVTLEVRGELNGCIGSILPAHPLGLAVARHAHAAAFEDPRLPPLRRADYGALEIEISVLSPLEPIAAGSRQEVIDRIRPGVDGLVLGVGERIAVFLPSVWDRLPGPDEFVDRLWYKAGIRPDPWPSPVEAARFTVRSFERSARAA